MSMLTRKELAGRIQSRGDKVVKTLPTGDKILVKILTAEEILQFEIELGKIEHESFEEGGVTKFRILNAADYSKAMRQLVYLGVMEGDEKFYQSPEDPLLVSLGKELTHQYVAVREANGMSKDVVEGESGNS